MNTIKDCNRRTLNADEREKLRNAISNAVLNSAFSSDEHEDDSTSYLRLVNAADIAHKECGFLLGDAVYQAKRIKHSWASIGDVLGISRQAAQQKFNPGTAPVAEFDEHKTRRITGAHAFNEMALLKVEGKAGNHLVGFGPLFLLVQESDQQWEHKRVLNFSWQVKEDLENKGWIYVGAWLPFLYYKRPVSDL
ncbi:MAG: hypothetical protein OQJ84_03940 [Xanthomonadales bacterium]|nr:hypothetical protein [Xanthomonadales bacterium]